MKKALLLLMLTVMVFVSCKHESKVIRVTSLTLNETSVVIKIGNSITLTATVLPGNASDKTITWTSSDESIVTIEDGVVIGLKEGNAIITAISDESGIKAECSVIVMEHPIFVSIPHQFYIAPKGESLSITCEVENDESDIIYQWYKSDDGSIENGTIIQDAESETLSLSSFEDKGLYYYFCQVKNIYQDSEGNEHESIAVPSNVVAVAYTGLPTVYIDSQIPTVDITRDEYVDASIVILGTDDYDLSKAITIKGRGNYSWDATDKKGYNIKFDKKNSVLGLAEAKKWCVVSNYFDKALMRNWLSTYISNVVQETTDWNPSFMYVDLILNGEYFGNYVITEAIQINDNRINVPGFKNLEKITNPAKYDEGIYLLEIDFRKDASHYFDSAICNIPFMLKDPDLDDYDDLAASSYVNYIKSVINDIEAEITASGFSEKPLNEIDYIDIDSFVDWYIVEEFAKNLDADFYSSVYMYYNPSDGKVHMGPHWDFDHSFGNSVRDLPDKSCSSYEGYWIHNSQGNWNSWYEYLLGNTAFLNAIKTRWNVLYSRLTQLCDAIDDKAEEIRVSAEANFKRWNVLGKFISGDAPGYKDRLTFQNEVDFLKSWIEKRIEWLNIQWGGI